MPRPSKGAHLYLRRRSGREPCWVIRDGGHEIGTRCPGSQRGEAEKRLAEYLAAKYRPDFGDGDPARIPVADILALYAQERAPLTRRPELAAYTMAPLARFWGDKMVSDVTAGRCRDYAEWRTAQPLAKFKAPERARTVTASTARRELGLLAAALNYAYREGKLKYPVPVSLPPNGPARLRWLTRSEAARLIWAAWRSGNRHVARFILIGLYTGTRHDAILRLRWLPSVDAGWVDLEAGLIYRRGSGESESSKRRPLVPISPRLAAHLRRWKGRGADASSQGHTGIKENGPAPNIYVISYGGLPIAKMRRAWHTARAALLGPECVPHVLRHTFASWAVQAGYSFAMIASAIGTTERAIESAYAHLSPDALRALVASVSGKGR
jgi:integrase